MENVLISCLKKRGSYLWIPFYRKPPTHTVWVEKSLIKDKILRFNETTIHANYVKGLCSQNILCEKDFIPRTLFPFLMKQERSTTKFFYVWRLSMLIFHSWGTTFQKADDNIWGTRSGWFGWLVQFQVQVRESFDSGFADQGRYEVVMSEQILSSLRDTWWLIWMVSTISSTSSRRDSFVSSFADRKTTQFVF